MTDELSDFHLDRVGSYSAGFPPIFLKIGPNTVGRTPTNNIVCTSKYVSRKHCEIFVTDTGVSVKNDITTNGIFINGTQKLERNVEICLNVNDILGIGCDTSIDEMLDEDCFIFQIKRKKTETSEEIIVLDDSDEEDEKTQVEYSQMNLSEMKQEMMELEDFVEEYNRVQNEPEEKDDDAEFVTSNDVGVGDIFEEIISNPDKSYAEKGDLIKTMAPDLASLLEKDCSTVKTEKLTRNEEIANEVNLIPAKPEGARVDKKSTTVNKPPGIKERRFTIHLTNINIVTKPKPEISKTPSAQQKTPVNKATNKNELEVQRAPPNSTTNKKELEGSIKPKFTSNILHRRNTCFVQSPHSSSTSFTKTATKRQVPIIDAPHMLKRRKSVSVMPESFKRQPKKVDPDSKWLSKNDKHPQNKRTKEKTDEIKSKLAALVQVPKEKVVEAKVSRPNFRIPIKNTHKTRSDQLTDTIVKTTNTPSKLKIIDSTTSSLHPEIAKRVRMTGNERDTTLRTAATTAPKLYTNEATTSSHYPENAKRFRLTGNENGITVRRASTTATTAPKLNFYGSIPHPHENLRNAGGEIAKEKPNVIEQKNSSSTSHRIVKKTDTKVKLDEASKSVHNGYNQATNNRSNDAPCFVFNGNSSGRVSPPVVKSILKKTQSIIKRRATVSFADVPRIKTIVSTKPVAKTEEENSDDIIHNIMLLGMTALKDSSKACTINGKNFAYKTVAPQYESLKHLQSVFIPLMKAELWKEIEDGYSRSKNTTAADAQMNYFVQIDDHPNRFKYHCETKSLSAVQIGALIIVLNVNSGKEFLGYIINRQVTSGTCYFQFVASINAQESTVHTPFKIKQVMYIRPNLKVFEALFKLQSSPLINHILSPKDNCIKHIGKSFSYKGYTSLNPDQMTTLNSVYRGCISGQPLISLIEGPPGTGKSRLITNLIMQLLYGKEVKQPIKILICAPSNAAVDILTKNLIDARKHYAINKGQKKMKLLRFGVLEKMDLCVRGASLQELTKENNTKTVLVEQGKLMECKKKRASELKYYTAKKDKEKMIALKNEISTIETKMKNITYDEKCLLEGANVICTTLNSCCTLSSKISSMDICIIDEATQCNEPTSLIPLQFGVKSLILVGDTKQLPSTVVSEIARQYNYDQSLFQRLQRSFESESANPILQLTTQYRMHPDILHWPNAYFYQNRLVSDDVTKNCPLKLKPYTVFNLNFEQESHTGPKHIANVDEAKFVRSLLDFLITKADPKSYSYGVISAYSQQKDDLAKDLNANYPYVQVNTIDSCQGQERDIVIISIARTRGIGFLAIRQRLNVALTRAKKMLILCGNFNSLQNHSMWISLLDDARKRKVYHLLPKIDDSSLSSYFEQCLVT